MPPPFEGRARVGVCKQVQVPNPLCGPQVLADAVARLVLDKFGDLTENFSSPHARRKVLAGIVMTTGKHLAL